LTARTAIVSAQQPMRLFAGGTQRSAASLPSAAVKKGLQDDVNQAARRDCRSPKPVTRRPSSERSTGQAFNLLLLQQAASSVGSSNAALRSRPGVEVDATGHT